MTRLKLVHRLRQLADELEVSSISASGPITRIDHWTVARRAVPCLIGIPTSHPRISDGQPLYSSELYYLDPDERIARSFSRWYELGNQVDPSYWEQRFPVQR
ncbi:hypothetical protein BMJ31_15270 [Sinorhizobium medicae]|nr:hypothetical protein BMJ31_15270 [Sinorhizobium medicae]